MYKVKIVKIKPCMYKIKHQTQVKWQLYRISVYINKVKTLSSLNDKTYTRASVELINVSSSSF